MDKSEATRYDRQVRLWGAAAQQRLQTTDVIIDGLDGLTTEVAKTLILAGVRRVVLRDASQRKCTLSDFNTNHFVYQSDVDNGRQLEESLTARLGELNPFVRVEPGHVLPVNVSAEGTPQPPSRSSSGVYHVALVSSLSDLSAKQASAKDGPTIAVTAWDAWTLGVFLSGDHSEAAKEIRTLFSPESLATAPRPFQLCALRLLVEDELKSAGGPRASMASTAFLDVLQSIDEVRDQYQLCCVTDDDVQRLLDASRGQYGCTTDASGALTPLEASLSSIACTVGGGFIAQQLIARVSRGATPAPTPLGAPTTHITESPAATPGPQLQPVYAWVATSTPIGEDDTECYVG